MSTKEFLKRAFTLNTAINAKMERVTKLRSLADSIGYERGELRAKIRHMERDLDAAIDRLIEQQTLIEKMIAGIPEERSRLVFELRYLNHLTWEEIGRRMHLDVRWAQRLHNRGIALLRMPAGEQADPEEKRSNLS